MRFVFAALIALAQPVQAQEVPDWFADAVLDVRDEVADAAKSGKRLMLYFWQPGCPYCKQMTSVTFREPAIIERLRRGFVPVAVNIRGDRDITWTDGATLSEKQLAAQLPVRGTPTLLFLDERGAIVRRLAGYSPPADFARVLEAAYKP